MRPGPVFEAILGNNSNAVAVRADDLDAKRGSSLRRSQRSALWPQPILQLPHEMQPVRRGPTPPKYGSSASMLGLPKQTPAGALLNISPLSISIETCCRLALCLIRSARLARLCELLAEHGYHLQAPPTQVPVQVVLPSRRASPSLTVESTDHHGCPR